jgi:hypothetical protein
MSAARAGPGRHGIVEYMSLASDVLIVEAQEDRLRATGIAATTPSSG